MFQFKKRPMLTHRGGAGKMSKTPYIAFIYTLYHDFAFR